MSIPILCRSTTWKKCKFSPSSPSSLFSTSISTSEPHAYSTDQDHSFAYNPYNPRWSSGNSKRRRSPFSDDFYNDERFVVISKLPLSVTPHDIHALSNHSKTGSKMMTHIRILYTRYLHPSGKAIVGFNTPTNARSFVEEAESKMIGGHYISTEQISSSRARSLIKPASESSSVRLAKALIPSHSGRMVRLRGLPSTVTLERMYSMLERYGLAPEKRWREPGNLDVGLPILKGDDASPESVGRLPAIIQLRPFHTDSMSTSFLVRLQKPFSAFRLASRWNSTYWDEDRTIARFRGRNLHGISGVESAITGIQPSRAKDQRWETDEEPNHNSQLESEFEVTDSDLDSQFHTDGLGQRRVGRSSWEGYNVMEELQPELGGGVSQDGGGRLHVLNAQILY